MLRAYEWCRGLYFQRKKRKTSRTEDEVWSVLNQLLISVKKKKQRKQARKRNWFTLLQIRYWFTGKKIFPSVLPKAVFTKVKVFTTHLCSWHRIEAPRTTYSEFLQKNFLNTQKRSKHCKKIQVKSLKNSSGWVFFCWVSSFSNKYFAYL